MRCWCLRRPASVGFTGYWQGGSGCRLSWFGRHTDSHPRFRRRLGRQSLLGTGDQELNGSGIELVKLQPGQPSPLDWLAEQTPEGGVVAVDGAVMAVASARTLSSKLEARGARLRTDIDLLKEVWSDRPTLPNAPIYQHLPPQATVSRGEKLAKLRESLQERGADWHFIATLDDIAWLFNLRGGDVSFNPVFVSFALINQQQARCSLR